jgi:ABC-type metal ion transport system substrate-binding protein
MKIAGAAAAPPPFSAPGRLARRRILFAGLAASLWSRGSARAAAPIRLGALHGPQETLLRLAITLHPARGLPIELVGADDPDTLAAALAAGHLDGIASHNSQELTRYNTAHGATLLPAFATVTLPVGIYSLKTHSIVLLRKGNLIVLPRPHLERDRARILLYNYGLLYAHEDGGLDPDLGNIVNPLGFEFHDADLPALPAALSSADTVLIPYGVAVAAGLKPSIDSIGLEDGKSPYQQVLAVRSADRQAAWLAPLSRAFQSRDVRRFIYDHYGDSVQTPW